MVIFGPLAFYFIFFFQNNNNNKKKRAAESFSFLKICKIIAIFHKYTP